ncbi:MAG: DUF5690 family protein [Siphonobacter sp.]
MKAISLTNRWALTGWLILAAFSTYFCMYAFRKPFTAATFEGVQLWGIDYKIILVITQVLGYAAAKGVGIKIISETKPRQRARRIILMIGLAEVALILFGLVPPPYNWVFLFFNGLPLGMVYGLVFGFLEGRRVTDLLGAGLCLSFILASGMVKSVGVWVLNQGISDYWMPAVVGLLFFPVLLITVWMLHVAPAPTLADEQARKPRVPMTALDRKQFFSSLAPGLIAFIIVYILVSMIRDIRDNFAVEIWKDLGVKTPEIFTITESWVGVVVILMVGMLFLVKSNRAAFWGNVFFVGVGMVLIPVATFFYQQGSLSSLVWMVLVGLGIYFAYVPFNGMLFERLIAVQPRRANVGFLFYISDFAAYMGSVAILLVKNFGTTHISWLAFFMKTTYVLPFISLGILVVAVLYFRRKLQTTTAAGQLTDQ